MLPFTADVYYAFLEQYNAAIWPAQIVAYVLALGVLAHTFRPVPQGGRLVGLALAAGWAWTGGVYHLTEFATINFAAPAYGIVFLLQALLMLWTAGIRGKAVFRARGDVFGRLGLMLAVVALVLHPLTAPVGGQAWTSAPVVGLAPSPTTTFTMGMLLLTAGRAPVHLAVIPLLWSLAAGTGAWMLGMWAELVLPLAGVGGFALILWKNRRTRMDTAGPVH